MPLRLTSWHAQLPTGASPSIKPFICSLLPLHGMQAEPAAEPAPWKPWKPDDDGGCGDGGDDAPMGHGAPVKQEAADVSEAEAGERPGLVEPEPAEEPARAEVRVAMCAPPPPLPP